MVATTTHPPAFNSFAYTVDIPIVSWTSARKTPGSHRAQRVLAVVLDSRGMRPTAAVVAGLTGILKRD